MTTENYEGLIRTVFGVINAMQTASHRGEVKNVAILAKHLTAICNECNTVHDYLLWSGQMDGIRKVAKSF